MSPVSFKLSETKLFPPGVVRPRGSPRVQGILEAIARAAAPYSAAPLSRRPVFSRVRIQARWPDRDCETMLHRVRKPDSVLACQKRIVDMSDPAPKKDAVPEATVDPSKP